MAFMSSISVCTMALLLAALCASDDRLVPGKPLLPGTTIVSDGGDFAFGFFSPSNSTPEKLYLGIWYNKIPRLTVVWVANRATPAISSSAPSLVLTNTSHLVLSDVKGRVLWTTNTTAAASSSPLPRSNATGGSVAVLINTGNLILRSPSGMVLWQSFDHPTDTVLPGMNIRYHKTHEENRLYSWNGPDDPSPGAFSVGAKTDTFIQGFIWNGSLPEWRGAVWTGATVTSQQFFQVNTTNVVYIAYVDSIDEMSTVFTVSDGAPPLRSVVSYSGRVEVSVWNRDSSEWAMLSVWPDYECSKYGYCGLSGYCDHTDATPTCKCLDGFEPVDKEEWSSARFSRGCKRKEVLRCSDGFLALPGMNVPDNFVRIGRKTIKECAAECSGNCSCVAYAYANLNGSTLDGDATRCLLWIGDHQLVDTQKMQGVRPYNAAGADSQGETLYLRVAGLSGERTKANAVKIILSALASVIVLTSIILIWICKFREEILEENTTHDFELPFLKFQDILCSTNNFSNTFMIGQGGFGKVYKVTLEGGQEVAIKRLSRDSDQGIQEFRNEVVLIANLQHRNLVRLLGCCVEGNERLLIYEYLPNKSLDAVIFNCERNAKLDWPIRFKIIKGVARGLLYLHHDSRLTIVHRDLKSSNILLDAEMRPKIADFGMARMFGDNQENANTRRVVGTYGYMAPEYAMEGIFSVKSDVYSFGVLLLRLAWNLWKEGKARDLVDKCIVENCLLDEASLCIHMGLLCVQEKPEDRPFMSSVVFNLENGCPTLPAPNHPAYFAQRNCDMVQMREDIMNSMNTVTLTAIEGR
uniref:Receptor-like serine/threonine-protein kinase n=1 Tax=Setaria italica TaxID=4555 RepID=K4A086_SETIT